MAVAAELQSPSWWHGCLNYFLRHPGPPAVVGWRGALCVWIDGYMSEYLHLSPISFANFYKESLQMYKPYKISLSDCEYKFEILNDGEIEILFERCTSRLNIGELGIDPNATILAESIWAETGERVKDTITILEEVEPPNYPTEQGYKTFHLAWDSAGAVDKGYLILRKQR